MILLEMDKPKSCKDCKLRNYVDDCAVTGEDIAREVDDELIAESCPIKGELPKDKNENRN
jgi:hypothetical protein